MSTSTLLFPDLVAQPVFSPHLTANQACLLYTVLVYYEREKKKKPKTKTFFKNGIENKPRASVKT